MLKVGDYVEYIGESSGVGGGPSKGEVYKIDKIDPDDALVPYRLVIENGETWWASESNVRDIKRKSILINLENEKEAHRLVSEAIREYKNKKFEWTENELEEVDKYYKELIASLVDRNLVPIFHSEGKLVTLRIYSCNVPTFFSRNASRIYLKNSVVAKPTGKDVFNEKVGKVVCLCKVLNCSIPDVIMRKNCK